MKYDDTEINEIAASLAGNWQKFDSFCWFDETENSEDWTIVYTSNRDSGLLEQSNSFYIDTQLQPYTESEDPDVVSESHSHWAVGYVEGYAIRVYKDGKLTEAIRTWLEIQSKLDNYPVLDEWDYSDREYKATNENIQEALRYFTRQNDLETDEEKLSSELFSWYWDNLQSAVENLDDRGGYPSEDEIEKGLIGLGYLQENQFEVEDEDDY